MWKVSYKQTCMIISDSNAMISEEVWDMRKTLTIVLTIIFAVSLAFAFTGCGKAKADYENPVKAIDALAAGENIVGKTVEVTASMDYFSMAGVAMIYNYTDLEPRQIMVCPTDNSGSDIKQGQTVMFRISNVDTHLPGRYVLEGSVIE